MATTKKSPGKKTTKKTAKRKRNLRRPTTVGTNGEVKHLKRLLQA